MKGTALIIGFACAALLAGARPSAPIRGALVIVHPDVPVERIDAAALKGIYTGRTTYWGDGQRVVIAVVSDLTDAALKEVSGKDASQFRTFWQRLVFSGRGKMPRKAADADSLVALVAATKGAIALVPEGTELEGVKTLEVK